MKKKLTALFVMLVLIMGLANAVVFADEDSESASYPELTVGSTISGTSGSAGEAYYFTFTCSEEFVYRFEVSASDYSGGFEMRVDTSYGSRGVSGTMEDNNMTMDLGDSGDFEAGEEYIGYVIFEDSENVSFSISVNYYDSGSLGDGIAWSIDRSNGVLTVSGLGAIEDYDDSPWYYTGLSDYVTAIVIEDGITSIGEWAFSYLENVTSVTLPDSLTEIEAFGLYDLESLTEVDLSNVVYIGGSALQGTALTDVSLSDELTCIGDYAFAGTSVSSITIPASVTEIGYSAFADCTNLTAITVEEENEYYIVSGDVLFDHDMTVLLCYPAGKEDSEYTIPDGVVEIADNAFSSSSLTTVNFADSVVTIGDDAFYHCTFTEIIIGKNVETIGYWAFESCFYLESVYIPLSVTEICDYAFFLWGDCSGVTYYYQGSEEQWNEIEIGMATCIDEGTVVYNCEDVWGSSNSTYSIIEAETAASYTFGSGVFPVIAVDADIAEFVSVSVEGTILTQDTDYTVTEGSTIITFAESYLESLEAGTYDVLITFTTGTAEGTLTVMTEISAEEEFSHITQIFGDNRYSTMKEVALNAFESSKYAVIAAGTNYPDALAASSLAGTLDAPVILVSDSKTEDALETLEELGITDVYIVGGYSAVSSSVEDLITESGVSVERVYGENRYLTAIEIANTVNEISDGSGTCIIASGANFPDALSGSAYSYWAKTPIYLARADGSLDDETLNAVSKAGYSNIIILGGESAVSEKTENTLGEIASVTRLGGANRYETSVLIAEWAAKQGMSYDNAVIATGINFPDALAGSALCGKNGSMMLLCAGTVDKSSGMIEALKENDAANVYILGGTAAVSYDIREAVEEALSE